MRPSEASALTWSDLDLDRTTISISKSRHIGYDSGPKTTASARTIRVLEPVIRALQLLPSRLLGLGDVFLNKFGEPMTEKSGASINGLSGLEGLVFGIENFTLLDTPSSLR